MQTFRNKYSKNLQWVVLLTLAYNQFQ